MTEYISILAFGVPARNLMMPPCDFTDCPHRVDLPTSVGITARRLFDEHITTTVDLEFLVACNSHRCVHNVPQAIEVYEMDGVLFTQYPLAFNTDGSTTDELIEHL